MNFKSKKPAYIALMAVLIVGAVVLAIAISSAVISIIHNENGLSAENLAQATELSSACAEKALMNLKENNDYSGGETITLGNGNCNILPIINLGGEARTIETEGQVNNVVRKSKISISTINPTITIDSWQEVNDF